MQQRHAVGRACHPDGKNCHAELLVAAARVLAPQGEELVAGDAKSVVPRAEVLVDEAWDELIDAGRDRGMGGEDAPGRRDLARFLKAQEARLHEPSHTLQPEEGGVPLIHMEDPRLIAKGLQRTHAADAEEDFLANTDISVAAV